MKKILISFFISFIMLFVLDVYDDTGEFINFSALRSYINNVIFTIPVDKYFDKLYEGETINDVFLPKFRNDENTNSKLKPILFMGCSYTYGEELEDDETISYKTAKLTNRPVYNRGGRGWGLDQLLYQLRRKDFIKTIGGGNRNF